MIVIAAIALGSCKDDDPQILTLSHEEIAHMVATAISESTSGFQAIVDNSVAKTEQVVEAHETKADCGFSEDHSVSSQSKPGADHTYNYIHNYSYQLMCGGENLIHMDADVSFEGEFDTPRLTTQHTGTIKLKISRLANETSTYHIAGDYLNDGIYHSRIKDNGSGENIIKLSSPDLTVNKATREIISGTASATITGTYPDKRPFAGEATITFHNDSTITILVRDMEFILHSENGALKPV